MEVDVRLENTGPPIYHRVLRIYDFPSTNDYLGVLTLLSRPGTLYLTSKISQSRDSESGMIVHRYDQEMCWRMGTGYSGKEIQRNSLLRRGPKEPLSSSNPYKRSYRHKRPKSSTSPSNITNRFGVFKGDQ